MSLTATTVGGYLRDLPADRRVAMARVCSMIRRSARGVRESMRYGLAFYELQGPLFALESTVNDMTLFIAEVSVIEQYQGTLKEVIKERSAIRFTDLNRIPLDSLERIVRDSVAARRERLKSGKAPTQKELLELWRISEEEAKAPPPVVKIPMTREEETPEEPVVEIIEEPKQPVEILRAPTFKDPAMTASSRPRIKKETAEIEDKPAKPRRKTTTRKKAATTNAEKDDTAPAKTKVATKSSAKTATRSVVKKRASHTVKKTTETVEVASETAKKKTVSARKQTTVAES